ncbi:hypothetical protein LguiA_033754 [Lonicera macranthoides]
MGVLAVVCYLRESKFIKISVKKGKKIIERVDGLLKLGRKNSSSTTESDNASGDVSQLDDNSVVSASSSSEGLLL